MLLSDDEHKKTMKKKSTTYQAKLKKAIHDGDLEQIITSVMLLAVKANDLDDWKASPRTFMELCQVLVKYRQEFGSDGSMEDILRVIGGSDVE
tara:strand:+ start:173 stop:451 length:279 start_codon:yes stop_codon:yes gene_type:complete